MGRVRVWEKVGLQVGRGWQQGPRMGVGVGSGRGAEAGKQKGTGSACHLIPSQDLPHAQPFSLQDPYSHKDIWAWNSISWGRGKEMQETETKPEERVARHVAGPGRERPSAAQEGGEGSGIIRQRGQHKSPPCLQCPVPCQDTQVHPAHSPSGG